MTNKTIDQLNALASIASDTVLMAAAAASDTIKRTTVGSLTTYLEGVLPGGSGAEVLTADRTYYVRTDGSDSNTGLVDSAGGAFLKIQKACDVASAVVTAGHVITIRVGDGTYAEDITASFPLSTTTIVITGASLNATLVVINSLTVQIGRVDITYINAGSQINATYCSRVRATSCILQNCSSLTAGRVEVYGSTFAQNTNNALYAVGGTIYMEGNIAISGSPIYTAFAYASMGGVIESSGVTFTGSATGARYDANLNGVIKVYGQGTSHFPGDSAGATSTGGQYAA